MADVPQNSRHQATATQREAERQLDAFLTSAEHRCYLLAGYAGTGKTYLIARLVGSLRSLGRPFVLMAPTGRAAKVLARRTGAPANTIHKVIYAMDDLKEYVQKNVDGSETYKFYFGLKNNPDDARTVYIVDEASMVSDTYSEGEFFRFGSGHLLRDLLRYINFDHNDHAKKLLLVGDPAQLPPVGANTSPALDHEYMARLLGAPPEGFELTDVVRQDADSGILDIATRLRDAIRDCRLNALEIVSGKPDVLPVSHGQVVERYAALGAAAPPENAVIIGYSNRLVGDYNRDIRARYFPGTSGPVPGDRLLVVANNHKGDVSLMNGDLVRLVAACPVVTSRTVTLRTRKGDKVLEKEVTLSFRNVEIEFRDTKDIPVRFKTCILENLLDSGERDLSSDEQKALYVDFKIRHPGLEPGTALFKDALRADNEFNALRVKYGYAMTCHKSQGGEWPHVFVDFTHGGGVFNLAYFRWAYTAVTRARQMLYLINAPRYTAITAATAPGLADCRVRDDLLVLPQACVDEESLGVALEAGESPFLGRLILAVSVLLGRSGIAMEKVEHFQFCEHIHFRREGLRAMVLVHYNARDVVTRILPGAQSDDALAREVATLLAPLAGKYIVVEGEQSAESAPVADMPVVPAGFPHIAQAAALLYERARADGVGIRQAQVVSRYHLYCVFVRGGHVAGVDYHFNGAGRLTRALSRPATTTSAELARQVMDYSAGESRPS